MQKLQSMFNQPKKQPVNPNQAALDRQAASDAARDARIAERRKADAMNQLALI